MRNPFSGHGSPVVGSRLVGRDKELDRLVRCLSVPGASYSIIGMPRIGKTSLIKEALSRIMGERKPPVVVWVDVSTPSGAAEMFQSLLEDFVSAIELADMEIPKSVAKLVDVPASGSYQAYRQFAKVLDLVRGTHAQLQVLLVFEEFDAVRHFDDGAETVRRLRAIANAGSLQSGIHSATETGLSCVFVSRRPLSAIEVHLTGVSTLSEMCHSQYLGPLGPSGLDAMVQRCGPSWTPSPEEFVLLESLTGGHPYLAEMALYYGWEQRSLSEGMKEAVGSFFAFYSEKMQRQLKEMEAFEQLLQIAVGPRWSLHPDSLARFQQYGLVRDVGTPEAPSFRAWSEHFQIYLEKCSRETPIWELWCETEMALREFVGKVLSRALGPEWQRRTCRHANVANLLSECEKRCERERESFGLTNGGDLLDYTYPDELSQIIFAEWENFRRCLGKDKRYWSERFQLLGKIRNPQAHNRLYVVAESELTIAHGYCRELLEVLRADENRGH